MKKYLFFIVALIGLLAACEADAQSTPSKTLSSTQYYYGDDANYSLTTAGDSVLNYTILINKPGAVYYDVQLNLDSVSGTPSYVLDLKGKVFASDPWTDLETDVTWVGSSSDTTVLFQEHSTAQFYRYIQLQVKGQAGTGAATLDNAEFKFWE